MEFTPLHHKPVVYGSEWADLAFIVLVCLHALAGAAGTVSGVVAMVSVKGKRRHVQAGTIFVRSMAAAALTGIVLDAIRLTLHVTENHTGYPGMAMPSSYPARIAFLYAAVCILYLLRQGVNRRVFSRKRTTPVSPGDRLAPAVLLAIGACLTVLIYARLSPFTGALWMIWTFMAGVLMSARVRVGAATNAAMNVVEHRFNMLLLVGFSWWAALQGFGPALALQISGPGESPGQYLGDKPGSYDPAFWLYLLVWVPPFLLAAWLYRRFARRRAAQGRPG